MIDNYESMLADEYSRQEELQVSGGYPDPVQPSQQVAMNSGRGLKNILGQIKKMNGPSTDSILDNVDAGPNSIMSPQAVDDIEAMLTRETGATDELEGRAPIATTDPVDSAQVSPFFEHKQLSNEEILKASQTGDVPTDKRTAQRSYNIERHHEGARAAINATFEQMQSADEFARVLDYIAQETEQKGSQTFDNIKAQVNTDKDIFRELEPVFKGQQKGLLNAQQNYAARVLASSLFEHLKKTSRTITDGDDSAENLAGLKQTTEQLNFIVQYVSNNATETARALGAHRMIAQSVKLGSLEDISRVLDASGGVQDAIAQANLISSLADIEEATGQSAASAFIGSAWRRFNTGVSASAEYWRAQILTSPKTHIVNMAGSAMQITWDGTVRSLAAGIGESRKQIGNITGKPVNDYVSHEEALAQISSSFMTIGDSWRMATRAFKQNEGRFTKDTKGDEDNKGDFNLIALDVGKLIFGDSGEQKAQVASDILLGSYRMLGAEDELGKAVGYRQELSAQAVRQSIREGLTGDAMWSRAGELVEMPTPEIHQVAMDAARRVTFQDEQRQGALLTQFVKATKSAVHEIPALGYFIPFIETPTNIGRRLIELTPMFPASKRWRDEFMAGGARADVANAKAIMAMSLSVAAWQMYDSGMLTGSGPEKWGVKEELKKEGWQPDSLKIGETYYSVDRVAPFGQALMAIGAYRDQAKYAGTEEEMIEAFAMSTMYIAENLTEMPFAKGFKDLLDAFSGEPYVLKKSITQIPSGFIPFSSAVKDVKDMIDPVTRTTSQDKSAQSGMGQAAWQHAKTRLPLVSLSMRPARYWDGTVKMPDAGRAAFAISPFKITHIKGEERRDPVNMALIDNGFAPAEPNPIVGFAGVEFSLVELDSGEGKIFDEYIKKLGAERREIYTKVVNSKSFKDTDDTGPDSVRFSALKGAENAAQKKALISFIKNDLKALLDNSENLSDIGEEINSKATIDAWVKEILATYGERRDDDDDFEKSVRLKGKAKMLAPKNIELNPLR